MPEKIFTLEHLTDIRHIKGILEKWLNIFCAKRAFPIFVVTSNPEGKIEIFSSLKAIEKKKLIKFLEQMIKDLNEGKEPVIIH